MAKALYAALSAGHILSSALLNPQGIVSVFSGCIFYAICYWYTENILYTIIPHALHNLLCYPDASRLYNEENGYSLLKLPVFIIYALVFAAGMIWLVKVFTKKYSYNKED